MIYSLRVHSGYRAKTIIFYECLLRLPWRRRRTIIIRMLHYIFYLLFIHRSPYQYGDGNFFRKLANNVRYFYISRSKLYFMFIKSFNNVHISSLEFVLTSCRLANVRKSNESNDIHR